jgi:hypothetical protein
MSDDDDRPPRYNEFGNEDQSGRFASYSDSREYARDIADKMDAAAAEGRRELGLGRSYGDEPATYDEPYAAGATRRGSGSASTNSGCAGVLLMIALGGGAVWMCSGRETAESRAPNVQSKPVSAPQPAVLETEKAERKPQRPARSNAKAEGSKGKRGALDPKVAEQVVPSVAAKADAPTIPADAVAKGEGPNSPAASAATPARGTTLAPAPAPPAPSPRRPEDMPSLAPSPLINRP